MHSLQKYRLLNIWRGPDTEIIKSRLLLRIHCFYRISWKSGTRG